jgi:hypothetical protein
MDMTIAERRALCGSIETREGTGVVAGASLRFAKVLFDNGTEAEYAWETIERLRGLQ